MRCFPFAEGNEVSASLASGALVAAQLAAGIEPSADALASLETPRRGGATTGGSSGGATAGQSAHESGTRSRTAVGNTSSLGLAGLGLPPPHPPQQTAVPTTSNSAHSTMVATLEEKLRELKLAAAGAALASSGSASAQPAAASRRDSASDEAQSRFNVTASPFAPQPIGTGRSPWGGSARPKSQPREQALVDGSQRSSPFVPDPSWRSRNVGAIGSPPTTSGPEIKHDSAPLLRTQPGGVVHELPRRPDEATTRAATPGGSGASLGQRIYAGGQTVDLSLLQAGATATSEA
jgi:hypothetical protein